MAKRKPPGFWEKEENIVAEARKVIKKNNLETLPNREKLRELGHSSLSFAITKYHGGFSKFRKLLGEEIVHWESLDYTIQQSKSIMQEHGLETLPNGDKLRELGHSSLSSAIYKYHGGFHNFRKILGEEQVREERGAWKSLDFTLHQIQAVMKKHDFETLPSQDELRGKGYASLVSAISEYHGGFQKIRKLLGLQPILGKWKSLDYTIQQAQEFMQEHNFEKLPPSKKLWKLGHSGLSNAITKYHGGFHKFRKLLGEEQIQREAGTWKSLDYTIQQAKKVMEEQNFETLPAQNKLQNLGHSSLFSAITKYHGGFHNFRKLLGEELIRTKMGQWKSLEYTIQQAKKAMEEQNFETLPAQNKLAEAGYSSLGFAIVKYHGGFPSFRKLLGEEPKRRETGTWKSLDYTLQQAREIMEECDLKTLPASNKLGELGYSSLCTAISKHHGGFPSFRKLLGEEQKRRETGTWKSLDYTIQQARDVMERHNFETLPSKPKLYELGHSSLSAAIRKYHGGFPAFRAVLEGKTSQTEKEKLTALVRKYAE